MQIKPQPEPARTVEGHGPLLIWSGLVKPPPGLVGLCSGRPEPRAPVKAAGFRAGMFNAFNRVRFGQGSLTLHSQTFAVLSQTGGAARSTRRDRCNRHWHYTL